MTKVLITGGAGFIGLHLARHLIATTDAQIVLADNLERGQLDRELEEIVGRPSRYQVEDRARRCWLHQLDLTLPDHVDSLGRDFDEVYHLAAVNGTQRFYEAPDHVLRTNALTTIHLLEWASQLKKPPRIVFTSSNEAYAGALAAFGTMPLPTPENVPLVVADPKNPRWSYGASKIFGEMLVTHYAARRGIPAAIVRPHNFYGPRAGDGHAIPQILRRIIQRRDPFAVYGIEETRSFCYITDAVDAIARVMEHRTSTDVQTYHVGSCEETRIGDLLDIMFEVAGWRPEHLEKHPSLPGSVMRRVPDVFRISAAVGWTAKTPLRTGLAKTLDWYAKNTTWFADAGAFA